MNREFFEKKIDKLSDDKLSELLRKTFNESNSIIFKLAMNEADKRDLKFELNKKEEKSSIEIVVNDKEKLRDWNWGAFLLAPVWTLSNRLEWWTILCFIPFLNIVVIFYLGYEGNKLAFEKSQVKSVDDFMLIQKKWNLWALRFFWFVLFIGLFAFIGGLIMD